MLRTFARSLSYAVIETFLFIVAGFQISMEMRRTFKHSANLPLYCLNIVAGTFIGISLVRVRKIAFHLNSARQSQTVLH